MEGTIEGMRLIKRKRQEKKDTYVDIKITGNQREKKNNSMLDSFGLPTPGFPLELRLY